MFGMEVLGKGWGNGKRLSDSVRHGCAVVWCSVGARDEALVKERKGEVGIRLGLWGVVGYKWKVEKI